MIRDALLLQEIAALIDRFRAWRRSLSDHHNIAWIALRCVLGLKVNLKSCIRQIWYEVGTRIDLLQIFCLLVRFINEKHGLIEMETGYAFGVFSRL